MLLEQETENKYGYHPDTLTQKSSKKVAVRCDYCQIDYESTPKRRTIGREYVQKDSCKKCRFKKREDVSMARYGVKNSTQRPEVLEKLTDIKWDDLKDKILFMYSEGYSLSYVCEKLNIPITSLTRRMHSWGVEIDSNSRRDKTMLEKYGEDYKEKSGEALKKRSQEKYGVDNPFQAEEVKAKSRQTSLSKYGVEYAIQDKEVAARVAKKSLQTKIDQGDVFMYDDKTVKELAVQQGFSRSRFSVLVSKHGIDAALTMVPRVSTLETTIENWLISQDIEYDKQFKIGRKSADFKIGHVIVEANGNFWHSMANKRHYKTYHQEKRQLYIDNGYIPLFFREDEINDKFPIVQSIILNKLGKSNRLFARKCSLDRVSKEDGRKFIEDNHLMGSINRGRYFGLFYEGELITIMSITRKKGDLYEISRMCHKMGYVVVGGFSRLLKFVEQSLPAMKSLLTFIDLRYGSGDHLLNLGFTEEKTHLSFHWFDGRHVFHRMKFPGNTGYDNGLAKIWDCGQKRMVKYDIN